MQLEQTMALHENDIIHSRNERSYNVLMKIGRIFLDNKLLDKNRHARNEDRYDAKFGAAAFVTGKGKQREKAKAKEEITTVSNSQLPKLSKVTAKTGYTKGCAQIQIHAVIITAIA